MPSAPVPENEDKRIEELDRYAILATAPEAEFDRFTRLASRLFQCPIALISFVAPNRQWFKSCIGLPVNETSRDVSFCAWAIILDHVLVVPDATKDPRFASNGLVTAPNGIRFYAGAPIVSRRGYKLGTLCIIDSVPRPAGLTQDEIETLRDLSSIVSRELEARLLRREQEETHSALKQEVERSSLLRAIVDSSQDAVISKSLDSVITSWNKSAERLFGYTAEEAIGQSITMLIPPDRLTEEQQIISRLKQGERVEHFETIRRRKDGSLIDLSLSISPVRDNSGAIVGASKVASDVTESKRMQKELERTNTLLEQFAYSASHDLQEPLRTVKIFADILLQQHGENLGPNGLSALQFLQSGATRMQALVRDLLAYTSVTKFEKPGQQVDANLAFDSALQTLGGSISENNAQVETLGSLPRLRMHFAHLQQLFENLIGNAIKYRKRGTPPVVLISAKHDASVWEISVEDNGIGIAPEYLKTIFIVFKRLHGAEEYSGTGLGLAICQRIVEQYGGDIWVESELSEGSIFRFIIPD